MQIGYRILRPEDVENLSVSFVQISLWKSADWGVADGEQAVREAIKMADACRKTGVRTIFHPLGYDLAGDPPPDLTGDQNTESGRVLRELAAAADLGIIVHDEGGPEGARLSDKAAGDYENEVHSISRICHVSVENSFNSKDSLWFWERFVAPEDDRVSITLDIGHLESAHVDSRDFIRTMPEHLIRRVRFVHMHRKGEERNGVVDHWPLEPDCREIEAMKLLLERIPDRDLRVILELDPRETREIQNSIALLEELG